MSRPKAHHPHFRRTLVGLGIASSLNCAISPQSQDSASPEDSSDSRVSESWSPEIEWTTAEATARAEQIFTGGFPDPLSILNIYVDMMAMGDDTCPGDETQMRTNLIPVEGCTAQSGYYYSGVAAYIVNESSDETRFVRESHLDAGILLRDDEGSTFEGGGNIVHGLEFHHVDEVDRWAGQISGSWVSGTGPEWLTEGVSSTLSMGGSRQDGVVEYSLNGAVSLMGVSVDFDDLRWDLSCGEHPWGTVGIRDPSGIWMWVELADDCTGCGQAVWDTKPDSEWICMDLSAAGDMLGRMAGELR